VLYLILGAGQILSVFTEKKNLTHGYMRWVALLLALQVSPEISKDGRKRKKILYNPYVVEPSFVGIVN
jgi:hypothetical protein